ncbi:dipeptidase [Dermabacteraceae bacterium TAE3-ERU27]|nr:dipeptidase [Dermabacteraceae bacterium TAE3-ERU27]
MSENASAFTSALQQREAEFSARLGEEMPRTLEQLIKLCQIPSVAFPGYDRAPVRESAEMVRQLLLDAGLEDVEIASVADGSPAVIGRRPAAPGKPTVMLYAHHDVQPEGDHALWTSPPFSPEVRGERLFGRGAADDKAGIMAHVTALRLAADALAETGVGVTVFVEGEEECGSPTFRPFIEKYSDKLRADAIVVADSANWAVGQPALTTSLRGVVDMEVSVRVLDHAVHSGMFGGPVLDALTLLSRLIATLHDDEGNVAVAGLVSAPEPEVEMPEEDLRRDASTVAGYRLAGSGSLTGRLWAKPALSVIGIDAPAVAGASNTMTPAARAKLSLRIAPGQEPADAMRALEEHLLANAPFGAQVEVTHGEEGKAFVAPQDSPGMRAARAAMHASWGVKPVDIGIGGSIPFIADLLEVFPQADILVTGVEDPDSRAHGIDESLHLGDFERVCLAEALLLSSIHLADN